MTHVDVRDEQTGEISDLYHSTYRRLVAQVYAFTTDLNEAQDAVQEAFARALARRDAFGGIDSPEAWLRTVAVNIVRRRWRRKQLLNTILLRERPLAKVIEDAPEPDRTDLREALATIPRSYREVIVLHYLADLPVDEVAAILEVPVGTVKSRLSRGREALKGLLDDVEAPPLDQVRKRAKDIRTKRRVAQATTAVAVVLASTVFFLPWGGGGSLPVTVNPSPTYVLSYAGSGLTLRSVPEPGTVPDIPGTIVQFDTGLLKTDADVWARSQDGGQTWEIIEYTPDPEQGLAWRAARLTPGGVQWEAEPGRARRNGVDIPLEGTADAVTATLDGERLIVMTLTDKTISGVYQVDAGGAEKLSDGGGMSINGEPVVLPDRRLLVADTHHRWRLSSDGGATWTGSGGTMPTVGSLHMTGDGYVALNMFDAGWVGVSPDGLDWQKLPIR